MYLCQDGLSIVDIYKFFQWFHCSSVVYLYNFLIILVYFRVSINRLIASNNTTRNLIFFFQYDRILSSLLDIHGKKVTWCESFSFSIKWQKTIHIHKKKKRQKTRICSEKLFFNFNFYEFWLINRPGPAKFQDHKF